MIKCGTIGEVFTGHSLQCRFHAVYECTWLCWKVGFFGDGPAELIRSCDYCFHALIFLHCPIKGDMRYSKLTYAGLASSLVVDI